MKALLRLSVLLVPAILLAWSGPLGAAEIDKYLPNDTVAVEVFNIRALLDSALFKPFIGKAQEAMKDEKVQAILKEIGLDPLKDIDSYVQTHGAKKLENALYLIHGKFNAEKLHAGAAKLMEDAPKMVKVSKVGDAKLYEVTLPLPGLPDALSQMYVTLVDESTIAASFSRAYIDEVFAKKAGKETTKLRKDISELIAKVPGKQTVWVVAFSEALDSVPIDEPKIKEVLEKVDHVYGGISVTDAIDADLTLVGKSAAGAADIAKLIKEGVAKIKEGSDDAPPEIKKVVEEVLNSLQVSTKDKDIHVKAHVSGKVIPKPVKD
jgi:hypothetical protein